MPNVESGWKKSIQQYFDAAAPAYAQIVDPVYAPLAQQLVEAATLEAGELVVDLGTGTGLVATAAASTGVNVIGIDFSYAMLRAAQSKAAVDYLRADVHALPLRSGRFDAALASFAINSSDPWIALTETYRILRRGGRLVLQEWGDNDELSELVSDTFAEYMVDEPPEELAHLRTQLEQPVPWDRIETLDELTNLIISVGFKKCELTHDSPQVILDDIGSFLQYKLAWPIRAAELAAMPNEIRSLCLSDLRENLAAYTNPQTGGLTWQPNIVRIHALKPG